MIIDKKGIYLITIFVIIIATGVGYAFLSSSLNILGNVTVRHPSSNQGGSQEQEEQPICRRAISLHAEECNSSNSEYGCNGKGYNDGDIIEFGNLGTTGSLAVGDAFDCDVNGDGIYNADTERFYYVSDLDTNSNYAVLVYYSNVASGVPDINDDAWEYQSSYDLNSPQYVGPTEAITQLPLVSQWSNVSLSNTSRNITNELGEVKVSNFSYQGYAARLLTVQEVSNACSATIDTSELEQDNYQLGKLDNCEFLLERSSYSGANSIDGYWLENVYSIPGPGDGATLYQNWVIESLGRTVIYESGVALYGVRPAIEVLKTKINY